MGLFLPLSTFFNSGESKLSFEVLVAPGHVVAPAVHPGTTAKVFLHFCSSEVWVDFELWFRALPQKEPSLKVPVRCGGQPQVIPSEL